MGRKDLAIVPLFGLVILGCLLHCDDARKLGPFIQYRSSLVLHFQPHLQNFSVPSYSGEERNPSYIEKEDAVEVKEEEDNEEEEEEEGGGMKEPHPADELLQTHRADGTKSYILGGY
ncbi:hypothetical protein SUGI_0591790 [Cryptomeria japonica]|uniref:uncharacterized protein LOC131030551 n=1 Tax=Cryptomeria japonica TaxID=3369 RepID=UPI0024149DAE|nr:uncharacterized protein LOC131030551 [Cryptomeria japonica]GLJ29937.1 hypothetical protein SUGI_0591790 [Cryptomeria japonica]